MEANEVILQSLTEKGYDLAIPGKVFPLPKKSASPKNILIVSKEDYEMIKEIATFKELLRLNLVRELERVPSSYYTSSEQVAVARQEVKDAKKLIEDKTKIIQKKDQEIASLKAEIESLGGKLKKEEK